MGLGGSMDIREYVRLAKEDIKEQIRAMGRTPILSIITVGEDPASQAYVRGKKKDAAEVGIEARHIVFPANVSEEELLSSIKEQNNDPAVDGIIVQLPVPKQISEAKINQTISPKKDVDGFTPLSSFKPCTPKGIIDYLSFLHFDFEGKNAVVIGRSEIVGKPMAKMLLAKNMNVTVLHSKTKEEDKAFYLAHADLIVVATGRRNIVDSHYIFKESAYVIDVGINRDEANHLHGDCEPNLPVALQTPVPGGVGLLTRLALLTNLLEASKR